MFWGAKKNTPKKGKYKLIVGLGNPGPEYAETRHNIGFQVIRELAAELGVRGKNSKYTALMAEGQLGGQKLLLVQPQTYMNRSGETIHRIFRDYPLESSDLLIICDDLDLDFGRLRLRARGGDGGHRGLRSIVNQLGTQEFARLRVGIGRPDSKEETADFVLDGFSAEEKELAQKVIAVAAEGSRRWVFEGVEKTMNWLNPWNPKLEKKQP